jgi:hypothetical protein
MLMTVVTACAQEDGVALCDDYCDCVSAITDCKTRCLDQVSNKRNAANASGCAGEFDLLLECAADNYQCSLEPAGGFGLGCEIALVSGCVSVSGPGCSAQESAMRTCDGSTE